MRRPVYTPSDVQGLVYDHDTPDPGVPPYTRGLYAEGYRRRLWTMRQFAGFGTPADTNRRYRDLLAAGGTGLSVAFDLPTLMGRDPDHELSRGEVGRCGVSVASLADMEELFADIDLAAVSTSMTINSPAPMLLAMYLVVAERRGIPWTALNGTLQNDILKEFIAQKEYIYPPVPSVRFVVDTMAFCTEHVPRWNSISVSGYHIREAGATAAQELAFTLRDGIEYVQAGIDAGLDVDTFAPRISFFFNAQSDLLEEVAKYRAARRLWATMMRDRFGARNPKSWQLRFHAQTAGVSLTAQQPMNNVVRTAVQALAAVLGGTQSLHTNALDEALALPTAEAATLALRTQQVVAFESGVTDLVDPLGGSYAVEQLTNDIETAAAALIAEIDARGGMVAAIEAGFPQREIADSAYREQRAIEQGEKVVVGTTSGTQGAARVAGGHAIGGAMATHWNTEGVPATNRSTAGIDVFTIDDQAEDRQRARLAELRATRDGSTVGVALQELGRAAEGAQNTLPAILNAVRAYATVGEMCDTLRQVWGEYEEVPIV